MLYALLHFFTFIFNLTVEKKNPSQPIILR